ncbi:hypothetical protein C0Q70_01633 [Pomacea canaliculata]|uniref:Uncharacterized protein n=1 Tax=Pomacea canaliculata TaxID=400727 RepID=A0A2T7Q039_POMCA|nr:hypothetical protein C0Q70_01633 [Pomacea canaliculata]
MNEAVTPAEHNRATVPVDIVGHVKHPLCAIITDDRESAWGGSFSRVLGFLEEEKNMEANDVDTGS